MKQICRICSGESELIHRGTRDNPDIDVFRCKECGTKFLVAAKEIIADYENGFMYATNNLKKLSIDERLKRTDADDKRRYSMVKDLCVDKKVLDFGCGFGGFLSYISNVCDCCYGVDLGLEEREYLNSNGIVCKKTIEQFEEKFDVITLFHVFEHLENPEYYLCKFKQYLKPKGLLIIEVPNAEDALLDLYDCEAFADFSYWSAHLFLYTEKSLKKCVTSVGDYECILSSQLQRYTLANHLYWLAKARPGGHEKWNKLDDDVLNEAYEKKLRENGACDTLYMIFRYIM